MNDKIAKLMKEVSPWLDRDPNSNARFKKDTPKEIIDKDKELTKEFEIEEQRILKDILSDD